MRFLSAKRVIIAAVLSLFLEIYLFNFIPRNINIIETRSIERAIFDYIINFIVFFVVLYLLSTLVLFVFSKFKREKKSIKT